MSVSEILMDADRCLEAEEFQKALVLYTEVLDGKSVHCCPEIFLKRSQCFIKTENITHAIQDAASAIRMDPTLIDGYIQYGKSLTMADRFEEALMIYRKGLEIDPKNAAITAYLQDMQKLIVASYEKKSKNMDTSYNALTLCSQEPYAGDDELAQYEKEIIDAKEFSKVPSFFCGRPDPERARQNAALAKKENKAGNLESAVKFYDTALESDPLNFELWAERGQVLHRLERLAEAFQCMSAIPSECRTGEMWKLGGSILADLNLPVTAESWLRQASQMNKKDDTEAATLFQRVRVHRLYNPLTEGTKVTVDFTQFGRALIAKRAISAGELIFKDKPVVICQTLDSTHIAACSNCARSLLKAEDYFGSRLKEDKKLREAVNRFWNKIPAVYCRFCDRETYCSEQCRDEAWSGHHQILCPHFNKASGRLYDACSELTERIKEKFHVWKDVWNASFSPLLLARVWASIICIAKQMAKESGLDKPTAFHWACAKSPYRRFIAFGAPGMAQCIYKMHEIMREVFQNVGDGLCYDITKREFEGRYFQMACNVQSFSDHQNPLSEFMKAIQNKPEYHFIFGLIDTATFPESMFAGVFTLHACLNHSCANNVEVLDYEMDGKPGLAVKARRNVAADEELYTTYINTVLPRRERRAWLYRGYNFWCNCLRCRFEGDGPDTCAQCEAKTTEGRKFPACGGCRRIWYCSPKCQKLSWKAGHKTVCSMPHSNTCSSSDAYIN